MDCLNNFPAKEATFKWPKAGYVDNNTFNKRRLVLAEEKTKITHITEGFDFIGFEYRQYKTNKGMKLLIKPSKESVKKAREKTKKVFTQLQGKQYGS